MSNKEFHEKEFDENTKCKLSLYQYYLREWLPVFIHNPHVNQINIFDFFAGPGSDACDNPGSPLIAIEEIQKAIKIKNVIVNLFLNELNKAKYERLKKRIKELKISNIKIYISNQEFKEVFTKSLPIMKASHSANFIFMDQFGIKEVTQNVFEEVTTIPQTDFMFYHAASSAHRFSHIESIRSKLPPISDEHWGKITNDNILRILCDAYYKWIPMQKRESYFLAPFSFKRRGNVNGLVFGSAHPKGIRKFLSVAWKHSKSHSGDGNYDNDRSGYEKGEEVFDFFKDLEPITKIDTFKNDIKQLFIEKKFKTNKNIFIFTLKYGMLPNHAMDIVQELISEGVIPKQKIHVSYKAWKKEAQVIQYHDFSDYLFNLM